MHAIFEYLPLVIFFIFYKFADIYWATGSLIVTSALQIGYYLYKKQAIPKRNLVFFALILVFGGLTIFFHDDAFLKWKVTIINALFAAVLIISQVFFKKNLIKEMMSEGLTLPDNIWARLNNAWALFFLVCAVLNIYIAYNFSLETWVNFKVFGLMGLTFVFAIGSIMAIYQYLPKEEENNESITKADNKSE
ncbi:septation protein A [Thalassotalea profundi]|uniref:Inner membrane-spanning protein YciB n=1 Tax=Thalassotalea profundi TaxID=2036687 RepID=A0ABQ3ITH2_9GAMM|nr:septation protein A [Thalassotalea profundi]GHE90432.1 putative intracellular septation protein A [Thalassotalea profundi]